MTKAKRPVYSRDFKIAAARRMAAGESPTMLSQELGVPRQQLYQWHTVLRQRGEEALRTGYGRPNKSELLAMAATQEEFAEARNLVEARKRIAQLEQKVGQQQVDLDFFKHALRHIEASHQPSDGPGGTASSRRSKR
jgi:transposase-like protein